MSRKILDNANKVYKNLFDTGKKRYKNLPYHHRSQSNWLEKENNNQLNPYYSYYKRGTIVFVEFGVNIGHELSGGHFAIVLNSNDNKRNSIVNVMPLSSKSKKYYLPIDKTVFENASALLQTRFKEFSESYRVKSEEFDKLKSEFDDMEKEVNKGIDIYDDVEESDRKRHSEELRGKIAAMKDGLPEMERLLRQNLKDKEDIEKVHMIYSKFDKNTYACYQSIQPASKLKIRRINKYDPSGKMKVDNETLNKIDAKIMEYYTNFSIDEI